mgnify:CR=1 FL=1
MAYRLASKENKEKILKIDVKEATEEKIDFKLTAYEDKEEMAIIDLYLIYEDRKAIAIQLKEQLSKICPVLIQGSLME